MKRGLLVILISICIAGLTWAGCDSTPSREDMVNYNGEWIPREEYIQIKEGETGESNTAPEAVPSSTEETEPELDVEPELPPDISISIEFTDCEQTYDEFRDSWGNYIDAPYEITNTGEVDILCCDLFFTVYCEGGAEYEDSDYFIGIDAGETVSDYAFIDVDGDQVDRVEITDWEIETYDDVFVYKTERDTIPSISCSAVDPSLYAEITIDEWEQEYSPYLEEWGCVEIYYEIENIGSVTIDYYKVDFEVECSGGKEYTDWDNGSDVKVGRTYSDHTIIDTNGRKVTDVNIIDWDLTSH